ncbi:MAG: hypothetical protein AMS26_07495 [Bacteroides sp. SM23_62]|nr:MAG: hypothetical protein AMS26_07495 [Bacteroides sp. SM23_62]
MSKQDLFDITRRDSQSTPVVPVSADEFDFEAYRAYEQSTIDFCRDFQQRDSSVAVYRRMRVAAVFADGCADMKKSLEWQLGGLQKSMEFRMDIPNFIEPWYGIGTAASAFGLEYLWQENQAPAIRPAFPDTESALRYPDIKPIRETTIGKHTLRMVEYFKDQSRGILPISLCDVQSPLNVAGNLIEINNFLMDTMVNVDLVGEFLKLLGGLIADFTAEQLNILQDQVVWPGHGFPSSRVFSGFGSSDDNILMITPEAYHDLAIPSLERMSGAFGEPVFHSCGNWSERADVVKQIPGLSMVDGAFTPQTDPDPNPPEPIRDAFAGTGITVCARMVGDPESIRSTIQRLWHPDLKLIAVTYCQDPEEQLRAYEFIHHHCI